MTHLVSRGGGVSVSTARPALSLTVYTPGDLIGGKLIFDAVGYADGWGGVIQSLCISDRAKKSANIDAIIFLQDPTSTTFTDNVRFEIADVDLEMIALVAHITDWTEFSDNSVGVVSGIAAPFKASPANKFWAALVARGAPGYDTEDDLLVTIGTVRE